MVDSVGAQHLAMLPTRGCIVCSDGSDFIVDYMKAAVSSSWPREDVRLGAAGELLTPSFSALVRPPSSESMSRSRSMPMTDIESDNMLIILSDSGASSWCR